MLNRRIIFNLSSSFTYFSVTNIVVKIIFCSVVFGYALGEYNEIFPNALFNEATIEHFIDEDIFFEIIHPKELQYTYRLHKARDFGSSFTRPYYGVRLVVADPPECCSYPYNSHSIRGAVAMVSRGECSFVSKTVMAEKAGAIAVIVTDDNAENDDVYIKMIDDNTKRKAKIPAAFLLGISGHVIQRKLREKHEEAAIINIPVNLTTVPIHKLNQPPWLIW
ncbi:UNVERIFIED_CONTAM: hypothetical protein RMT77_017261 [Armadillidium vulgare]